MDTRDTRDTKELLSILNSIETMESLEKYTGTTLKEIEEVTLADYFNKICRANNIKKSELIKNSDMDRTYGYQILDGKKMPSRDNIIKLCIGAHLDLSETERALVIGNAAKLYPKRIRDSIIIYSINRRLSIIEINIFLSEKGEATLGKDY